MHSQTSKGNFVRQLGVTAQHAAQIAGAAHTMYEVGKGVTGFIRVALPYVRAASIAL